MTIISRWGLAVAAGALAVSFNANAQENHYRFAHDQQLNSGYSVAYFSAKLKQLSGGKMLVDQYPGAQLGQEPQLLQLVKSGDLDFAIVSSANMPIYVVFFATIAFCIYFPEVVLWIPKHVLAASVGCFKNPIGTGYICP
jgi:TRAP-type C4-dicarboxylate transport system substrate-binding protein